MKFRDRVKEFRRVSARELRANPRNWRTHPKEQRAALSAMLREVGFAGATLAYETPEGLELIDGHLRVDLADDAEIPCLILDVNEEEANKLLLTIDPVGAMAAADSDQLRALMESVETEDQDLADMIAGLAEENGIGEEPVEIVEDEVPDAPVVPITQPGDLWLLGAYFECEDCHKRYSYEEGLAMEECPCG